MALGDSGRAIGAVTKLLQDRLVRKGFDVHIGKPEQIAQASGIGARVSLFLYQTDVDSSLRNVSLDEQRAPPLWFSLHYLLTAFDAEGMSDSAAAHELLGRGLSALHELNFLSLDAAVAPDVRRALENSPEPLKLTFEDTPAELLSKLMQGSEERYRLSVSFQVRPVMIVPDEEPSYALLVGIDYSVSPSAVIGPDGIRIEALPSLGPALDRVDPAAFEPGAEIELYGRDFADGMECWLGGTRLEILSIRTERMRVRVDSVPPGAIAAGTAIAAGEQVLSLRQPTFPGHFRSSNLLVAELLPVVSGASLAAGTLTVQGLLLGRRDADGRAEDDVLVALHRQGRILRLLDAGVPGADQQSLSVAIAGLTPPIPAGDCQVIVRVNGRQARSSPTVSFP